MRPFTCLMLITFVESLSLALAGIGIYFYTHEILHFTDGQNLALAMSVGTCYVLGALASHRVSNALGEKTALITALTGQLLAHTLMVLAPDSAPVVVGGSIVFGFCGGLKWPVVESYVSAGRTPEQTARAVGHFNMAWSLATPLGIIAAGPLIDSFEPRLLFAVAMFADLCSLAATLPLDKAPEHLPADHPHRLPEDQRTRWSALLRSSRWSMAITYAVLQIINAVLPGIFDRLGITVAVATALAGLIHWPRFVAFLLMRYSTGWHGRVGLNVLILLGIPLGFALIVAEHSLPTVLAGELVLGAVSGMTYYTALYYAMVIKNASVDAGGRHETAIGLGLAGGPAIGLVGAKMAGLTGSQALGMLLGTGPFLLLVTFASAWPLREAIRRRTDR